METAASTVPRVRCIGLLALLIVPCVFACSQEPAAEVHPLPATTSPQDFQALGYGGWTEPVEAHSQPPRGVTLHLESEAHPGVNLFSDEQSTCFAVDMNGEILHTWHVPIHDQVECFELLDDGSILALSVDQGLTHLSRDSKVLWQVPMACHHDLALLPDGTWLVPSHREVEHAGRTVRFDEIVHLDAEGQELERWDSFEHKTQLDPLHKVHALDSPGSEASDTVYDYYHLNAIEVLMADAPGLSSSGLAAGTRLLCLRNVDLIVALDPITLLPTWSAGTEFLQRPHCPTLTPEGTLLVFDNGPKRGSSRLLEIDVQTRQPVWSWQADPPEAFFSAVRGSCQRLPNGNTLVTESERGRVFELSRRGRLVWEFWNPFLRDGKRKRVYRMQRVNHEQTTGWLPNR